MYKISNLAEADIASILDFSYEQFGMDVMINYHESLTSCFETLAQNPQIGLKSDCIRDGYFRFNHQSHVVFYKIQAEMIMIVRVLHKSMNVEKWFE